MDQGLGVLRLMTVTAVAAVLSACIPTVENPPYTASAPRLDTDPDVLGPSGAAKPPQSTWQMRPVVPDAKLVREAQYTVRAGDTLRAIAAKTGASSYLIAKANAIEPPYIISIGQTLRIPGGRYHRVQPGHTGIAIARAYGVSWPDMVALNDLEEPFILRSGQALLLPGNAPVDPASLPLEQRAAAFDLGIDDIVTGGQPASSESGTPSDWRRTVTPDAPIVAPATFDGKFIWPVRGKILTPFGDQGGGQVNDGLNIAAAMGAPVRAAAGGVVVYAGDEIAVFGGLILIDHGDGWVTAYGHAAQLKVKRGDTVNAGDVIALAGDSGYVSEPQLHFEIRKNRQPVDPARYLGQQAALNRARP